MDDQNESNKYLTIPNQKNLSAKSSSIVKRGLNMLNRYGWTEFQLEEDSFFWYNTLSPSGNICQSKHDTEEHGFNHIIKIFNTEPTYSSFEVIAKSFYRYRDQNGKGIFDYYRVEPAVSFAWPPCSRYIVTGSGNHERILRLFDIEERNYIQMIGSHNDCLYNIEWSNNSNYIASASTTWPPFLKIWKCIWEDNLFGHLLKEVKFASEISGVTNYAPQMFDPQENRWQGLHGFDALGFHPDSHHLAAVAAIRNSNDMVYIFNIPSLTEISSFTLNRLITSISYTYNGTSLISVSKERNGVGRAYKVLFTSNNTLLSITDLNIRADQCYCNPNYNICAFVTRTLLLDNLVSSSISIYDLRDLSLISEYECSSKISDICWSLNGDKLYAISQTGVFITYDLSLN